MLITRLDLENIKSYKQVSLRFQRGTTAISGANGAGKTTLVEAIGFALFNLMPYKQDQFVREGEKYGRIVVHLVGSDDRPYVVERRCGTGSSWTLYDTEANLRLEQRTDVLDKLHEICGIERERSLEDLFRDALGVPQGTFTAIFLQKPAIRKQTFDSLLQIEDYRTAFDYLLEAQKQYKEQATVQESTIQRLTIETRDLDNWRAALQEAHRRDQELKARNIACAQRLAQQQAASARLKQCQAELQQCQARRERAQLIHENAQQRLSATELALTEARAAQQAVETARPAYQRYQETTTNLDHLRQKEQRRNTLRQQQAALDSKLSTTRANIQHTQQRLDEIEHARRQLLSLLPLAEKQGELETRIATLTLEVERYETLKKEGNRLYQLRDKSQRALAEARRRIAEIEPLQALAALRDERLARKTLLQTQSEHRQEKHLQLQEKQQTMQEKQSELTQVLARLNKAENAIARIEAHRQEGEEYALLLKQQQELEKQRHHLRGTIESYADSRARSAGGQCPLLHQACLNIQRQGQLSLEAYFDGLLDEEEARLAEVTRQLGELEQRGAAIQKYAEALDKLGQYLEQRTASTERLERLNVEIRRLEREIERLRDEWESLQQIEQEIAQAQTLYAESEQADRQVRQLPGLSKQVEQIEEQIAQYTADFEERKRQAEPLQQSKATLDECRQALADLNDPRSKSKAAQEIMKQEEKYQQELLDLQETLQELTTRREKLAADLETYAHLDQAIAEQEQIRAQSEPGYQTYLKHIETAARLPERTQQRNAARDAVDEAERALAQAQEAYRQAAAAFDEAEFQTIETEIEQLQHEISSLAANMSNLQQHINTLEQQIAATETLLTDLEAAQQELRTLEELTTMMELFRKLIKEAAPYVLRAMLTDISAEANRIFGEIMGDRSAQLNWGDDYEITLLRRSVKRSFAQLSGGEQMSAALALRLALLKKLSTLNLAFFDEPTQNMDEQRRTNLAEQIRRVRGFDQLIVISHDDTFEQGLDSLVRLRKEDGQTYLLNEDDERNPSIPPADHSILEMADTLPTGD